LRRLATGTLSAARRMPIGAAGAVPAQDRAGAACVPIGPPQSLRVPLNPAIAGPGSTVQPIVTSGLPYTIRLTYVMPSRSAFAVYLGNGTRLTFVQYNRIRGARRGAALMLDRNPVAADFIQLNLPGGACVTGITLAQYQLSS
jgi:hypothetical protein